MLDTRIAWIWKKIYNCYCLLDEDIFNKFLMSNNESNKKILLNFLDTPCSGEGKLIVFFITEHEFEEEVELGFGKV